MIEYLEILNAFSQFIRLVLIVSGFTLIGTWTVAGLVNINEIKYRTGIHLGIFQKIGYLMAGPLFNYWRSDTNGTY